MQVDSGYNLFRRHGRKGKWFEGVGSLYSTEHG